MSISKKTKTIFPVSLDEAKRHLRIDEGFNIDDDYINNLIMAATLRAEQYIGKDIAVTTNVHKLKDFYTSSIVLDEGNFISFESCVNDASVSFMPNNIESGYSYTTLEFANNINADYLTLNYTTGYAEDECPLVIKQAILIKIADLYDVDRQSYNLGSFKENKAFESLLDSFRYINF